MKTKILILFFVIGVFGSYCSEGSTIPQEDNFVYNTPVKINDGWETASLESVGINTQEIVKITNEILTEERFENICSYLIVKNGKLVHEVYNPDYQRNSIYALASITKTFTSTLIGIAIDKGFIKSEDSKLVDLLPEYAELFNDPRKKKIALKHIMSMSLGMDWVENVSYNHPRNSEHQMVDSEDWMYFVLKTPMKDEPGTQFLYNTGGIHLLSAVIKNATGMFANEFAEKYLLHPLGIYAYQWNRDSKGYPCTGGTDGGINLRTRDLAKFGWLFFKDGTWKGKRIISQEWIKKATQIRFNRYGYNWFSGGMTVKGKRIEYTGSFGFGGQTMYLVPELDLILVFTCELFEEGSNVHIPVLKTFNAIIEN